MVFSGPDVQTNMLIFGSSTTPIEEVVATDIAVSVCMEIEETPTAFDKEKVIEELKGEIELCVTHPLYPGRYIKKDRAIDIVEKGGIE